jgi:hypothetical protein
MGDGAVMEHALKFGTDGRLFGIVTEPDSLAPSDERPAFVFLNAGLIHRIGPYRIHVTLARELAARGFVSVRVDLSGRGDSADRTPPDGTADPSSVDLQEIADGLEARYGTRRIVLVGLCSGADNAIRAAPLDPRLTGLCLLDAYCPSAPGLDAVAHRGDENEPDQLALRDLPNLDQTRAAFGSVIDRGGRALSVFTEYAACYYDRAGRLGDAVGLPSYAAHCTEIFWPDADHTFTLGAHRDRLIGSILAWTDTLGSGSPVGGRMPPGVPAGPSTSSDGTDPRP